MKKSEMWDLISKCIDGLTTVDGQSHGDLPEILLAEIEAAGMLPPVNTCKIISDGKGGFKHSQLERKWDAETRDKERLYKVFCIAIPKPITPEYLAEASAAGLILKKDLQDGKYYYGRCRNASVAMWDATNGVFWYIRHKWGSSFKEDIYHPEDDDGFDLFIPTEEVEPTEEEKIK